MRYWGTFAGVPQWVFALAALGFVGAINMVAVKWFGELEFWFSLIKVAALVLFLVVGVAILVTGHHVGGMVPGLHLIAGNGVSSARAAAGRHHHPRRGLRLFGIELLGVAAGEAQDAQKICRAPINGVMWRIGLFYVGSVTLLVLLMPWTAYKAASVRS